MRAVLVSVSPLDLERRRKLGQDRFDEMWQGELHMVPFPSFDHQDAATTLSAFLSTHAARRQLGKVVMQVGVHDPANPDANYRGPDIAFVARGNEPVIQDRGIVGPADSVIEIRSPGDETYDKFPFFAGLGIREDVVIDRDTRRPEVYRLVGNAYLAVAPDREGWVTAEVLRVRFRLASDRRAVRVESLDDPAHFAEI